MANAISRVDSQGRMKLFADWTIASRPRAAGERTKASAGHRAKVVITQWDWSRATAYLHDEISTDKRKPTVNANGSSSAPPRKVPISSRCSTRAAHRDRGQTHPVRDPATPSSLTLPFRLRPMGRNGDLEQPDLDAQSDARRAGSGVVHRARASARPSRFLPAGRTSFGQRISSQSLEPHLSMYDPSRASSP